MSIVLNNDIIAMIYREYHKLSFENTLQIISNKVTLIKSYDQEPDKYFTYTYYICCDFACRINKPKAYFTSKYL
jgi:hypothetical protein